MIISQDVIEVILHKHSKPSVNDIEQLRDAISHDRKQ